MRIRSPLAGLVFALALVGAAECGAQQSNAVPAPAATVSRAAPPAVPERRNLDLTAPDVRKVMPEEQWRSPLEDLDSSADSQEDTVQVRGTRTTPDVPGGIAALFWALRHPSEAWRIVAPVP